MAVVIVNPHILNQYSVEALAVFANLGTLTTPEKNAIATFVDGCVSDGNWSLFEYFLLGKNYASANWYLDWINGVGAIKGDGSTPSTYPTEETTGYGGDGSARYLNLNWNPTDDGGVNIAVDRFGMGCRVESLTLTSGYAFAMGGDSTSDASKILWDYASNNMDFQVNLGNFIHPTGATNSTTGNLAVQQIRDSYPSGTQRGQAYIDGSQTDSIVGSGTNLTAIDIVGLARNSNSTIVTYMNGVISCFYFFDPVGFDHSAFNTRLNTLLAAI